MEPYISFNIPFGIGAINIPFGEFRGRRGNKDEKLNPILLAGQRFVQIFNDHGIAISQIPRFLPELTLGQLQSNEKLLEVFSPNHIDKAAKLFGVRREWLEGRSIRMYDSLRCYKDQQRFFEEMRTLNIADEVHPVVAFCTDEKFYKKRGTQPLMLVLLDKYGSGEETFTRYRIFSDGMNWNYWKCQYQIRAMIRLYYQLYRLPVPIYRISSQDHKALENGFMSPGRLMLRHNRLEDVFLEDFSMFSHESHVAKEDGLICALHHAHSEEFADAIEKMLDKRISNLDNGFDCKAP